MLSRRSIVLGGVSAVFSTNLLVEKTFATAPAAEVEPWAQKLIAAAESRWERRLTMTPLLYAAEISRRGRSSRSRSLHRCHHPRLSGGLNADLQALVHNDMRKAFTQYPRNWGLKRPDPNIDHRRVPNLAVFFNRSKAALPVTKVAEDYRPGDLVAQMLPGNLPHIAIVTQRYNAEGTRLLVVHNIGAGTRIEDRLFEFPITGHFRYRADA